ncbi:MAG: hypothetical protein AAGK21_09400 [Bacteroidota bacterium]
MFTRIPRGIAALALMGSLTLTACDSGEPDDDGPGEQELITQVNVMLTPEGGGAEQMFTLNYDALGNLTGTSGQVNLSPGVTYGGEIELLDTINNEDITEEIEEEAEEHLFAYTLSPASAGTVSITDVESDYTSGDENGGDFLVGLQFEIAVSPTASGTATMTGILYHFDDEPKTGSMVTSDEIDVEFDVALTF